MCCEVTCYNVNVSVRTIIETGGYAFDDKFTIVDFIYSNIINNIYYFVIGIYLLHIEYIDVKQIVGI